MVMVRIIVVGHVRVEDIRNEIDVFLIQKFVLLAHMVDEINIGIEAVGEYVELIGVKKIFTEQMHILVFLWEMGDIHLIGQSICIIVQINLLIHVIHQIEMVRIIVVGHVTQIIIDHEIVVFQRKSFVIFDIVDGDTKHGDEVHGEVVYLQTVEQIHINLVRQLK